MQTAPVMPNGLDICSRLAPWHPVEHAFADRSLTSVDDELRRQLLGSTALDALPTGSRVALAVGSRGIHGLSRILRSLTEALVERGLTPFVVPAMGSHGGGTAEGQEELLAALDVTLEKVGAPVRSCMDTIALGEVHGVTVFTDRVATEEADAVIPIARIKPHTDFRGPVESGLMKMLAIGMGKHRGADSVHQVPADDFSEMIIAAAQMVLASVNVPFGVAIVEDAYDRTALIEVVEADNFLAREMELLTKATAWMPTLPFRDVDLLIVGEMGKNISGTGMDPNITGRFYAPRADVTLRARRLVALNLTPQTHGNATGVGMADVVTRSLADSIDWRSTYTNEVASRMIEGAKLPLVAADDQDAIAVAVHCLGLTKPQDATIAYIENTLSLSNFWASAPLWESLKDNESLTVNGPGHKPQFERGKLTVGPTKSKENSRS